MIPTASKTEFKVESFYLWCKNNVVNTTLSHDIIWKHRGVPYSVLMVLFEGNSLITNGFILQMVSNVWKFDGLFLLARKNNLPVDLLGLRCINFM